MSTRQTPGLVDNHRRQINLGDEIGHGGEGWVYAVSGDDTKVAKIYKSPTTPDRDVKLAAMVSMATENDEFFKWGAWPANTVHYANGKLVGFLMPRIEDHRPIYQLYSPNLRLQEFPGTDWRFLYAAATNAARAFAFAHKQGLIVGDVNHGNLLVAQDATCRFIDFDSFQITHWGQQWLCNVGTPDYQPPEMGTSFTGVVRTPNHDNFGLAILIFRLLFAGRHPFSGVYQLAGDSPQVRDAILKFRYAFSQETLRTQMLPPPHSLPVDALSPTIRDMFEAAFSPKTALGGRPTAANWVEALRDVGASLRQCSHNSAHFYLRHCNWCEIERAIGTPLFLPPGVPLTSAPITSSAPPPTWNWPPIPPSPPKPKRVRRPAQPPAQPIPPAQPARPWYQAPPGGIPPQAPTMPPQVPQAAQTIAWQAGWLFAKARAKAHPVFMTVFALVCILYLIGKATHEPAQHVVPTAQSTGFSNSAPPSHPLTTTEAEKRFLTGAPPVAPQQQAVVTPPIATPAPLPRVVTPDSPPVTYTPPPSAITAPPPPVTYTPPPSAPIQPDITLPALRPPGATPQTTLPAFHDRVGPSFDCTKAKTPVFQFICGDDALARSNLEMMQPFYVLGNQFQFGQSRIESQAGWKNLLAELTDFYDQTFSACGIDPKDGAISGIATDLQVCLNLAFTNQRKRWMSELEGDGLEEASRNIEHHIALQYQLKLLGYAPPTDRIDGNYGASTRAAIVRWQIASSLPPTGLLNNSQVSALLQSQPTATPATEPQAFLDGQRDRRDWETWVAGLSSAAHEGVDYWASHRSMPHPACGSLSVEARTGCMAAVGKLTAVDARRKADPDYRRGWNTY